MKRTTVMVDENLLLELKQIAQQQKKSTSSIIREALASYVARQYQSTPPPNPLLDLVGLAASDEPTDVSEGQDEEILSQEIDPTYGWSTADDRPG